LPTILVARQAMITSGIVYSALKCSCNCSGSSAFVHPSNPCAPCLLAFCLPDLGSWVLRGRTPLNLHSPA
jgi:hypothetical protein